MNDVVATRLVRYTLLMKSRSPTTWVAVAAGLFALASRGFAQDWPQWRGPNRDGATTSFNAPASWPNQLTQRWKVDIGYGYATPILVGERIYMFTRQGEDEVMSALDAASGDVTWRTSYPAPFDMNPATRRHGPGPKSTPAFSAGRLFTLGMTGAVTAFDAETGRQLWQKPGQPVQPLYHTATSPIVDGDLVILHVGGHDDGALTAFEVTTGDVRWSWDGDGPAYGSPMLFELSGTRQVVTFTQENFVGVSLESGELLWRRPYTTASTTTSQTPILYKETVIEAGRGNGITAIRVVRQGDTWTTENVWHTDEVSLHMTNGVVVDGVLFGLSHLNSGQYFGLDLDTGEILWKSEPRQAENAGIVRAGTTIFSLEDEAELLVVGHSRTGFELLGRYQVANSPTWTQPTVSGNRIFVKDVSTLTLFALE
ncbi:MAG: PQQ-like beta-propeller repeat protein [Acidobacteriota bacterium]|nr:MAG: PQQ-like beta-propeller repeat protein [Acidobacteriota bacterium]